MDTFASKDNNLDDNAYHKAVRTYAEQPVSTEDDRQFTKDKFANTIGSMNNNKAPGTDGITGNIYKPGPQYDSDLRIRAIQRLPEAGYFPNNLEGGKDNPLY